jgi:hypothetical protein
LHFPASKSRALRGIGLSAVAVLLLVLGAPVAVAAPDRGSEDPSAAQYDSTAEQVAEGAGSGGGGGDGGGLHGRVVGALPFTGVDVVVVSLAAFAVMGAGLALSRVTRPRTGNDEARTR